MKMKDEQKHIKINEEKWDKWAKTLDGQGWRYDFLRRAQQGVVSLLDLRGGIKILDIGCGTGWALKLAADLINNNGSFYGADLSLKMIEKAEENFKGNGNFHFISANAESIPLEDNFFDIIICTNSFHHYLNPLKAMEEMKRLLRAGGKVYILDPTADSIFIKAIDKIIRLLEPEHVKMYSTEEFRKMFASAGLKYKRTEIVQPKQKVHIAEK